MIFNLSRIDREKYTVGKMIDLYCRLNHRQKHICEDCQTLKDYAFGKLKKCPYQDDKPTCIKCPIHCYQPNQKEQIRVVMRFSGPKMILYHPILAVYHIIDNKAKKKNELKLLKKN
jgi:hypothetical protein